MGTYHCHNHEHSINTFQRYSSPRHRFHAKNEEEMRNYCNAKLGKCSCSCKNCPTPAAQNFEILPAWSSQTGNGFSSPPSGVDAKWPTIDRLLLVRFGCHRSKLESSHCPPLPSSIASNRYVMTAQLPASTSNAFARMLDFHSRWPIPTLPPQLPRAPFPDP